MLSLLLVAFRPGTLRVKSLAFSEGGRIPAKYTCEGLNTSPPLKVTDIPAGTRSLAIIVHDPDAPHPGGVTHWVAWDLPLDGNIPGNFTGGGQGLNSDHKTGYMGMCPPTGTHRYYFKVYALDTRLQLGGNTGKAALEKAMQGHILAEGALMGRYSKGR